MEDLDFVRRCTGPDKEAQEEFVRRYCRLIYSAIHSFFRSYGAAASAQTVEDLYQEILAGLFKDNFRKLKSYRAKNNASLASWLRQVAINRCIDHARRKPPPAVSLDAPVADGLTLSDIIPFRGASALEQASRKEEKEHLLECIERLGSEEQFFLELALTWELTLAQIQQYYRISRPAVDMRKSRIMDKLRDCFRSKGYDVE
jgi:RNA polymerase sigma factor (sigma-70 family)